MEKKSITTGIRPNRQMRRASLQKRIKGETRPGRKVYMHGGATGTDDSAIYVPKKVSFKGYMRIKPTFNKRKRAS